MVAVTSSSGATTSLVAALGGGSGIDMVALAETLAKAQFAQRQDRLTAKGELLDLQITAASTLKNMIQGLATSLGQRVRQGDLSPQPQLANPAVARASLSGSRQPSGTFALEVTALARQQTLASEPFAAATAATGSGTLTLRFGAISGGTFTEDAAHAAAAITVAAGATLADVAAAINGAGAGVSAYIANTVDGAQLVLKGADGASNGFILEATEEPTEPGLAALAWTPAAATGQLLASAQDAAFKIDGLAMTSASNTVIDAIPGVTLALTATNSGAPTSVTFSDPVSAISTAMADLTEALNEVAGALNNDTNAQSGELARDSGARALRHGFAALSGTIVMPNAPAGAPRTLGDLGLSTQRDGSFLLDTRRLAATLKADPNGAAAMFTNGLRGVYATIDAMARQVAKAGDPGTLAGSIARYTRQKSQVGEDLAKMAEKQEALRAQFTRRFAASDSRVGGLRSTLGFLQNQIDAWNAQGRG